MEPDKRLDERLKDEGYEQSKDNSSVYEKTDDKGFVRKTETEGTWFKRDGEQAWTNNY